MESELKCPVCGKLYWKPLLLPCSHNVCSACAHNLQESAENFSSEKDDSSDQLDFPEIDKLSIVSETDSGVVLDSRPCSFVSTPSINNLFLSSNYHSRDRVNSVFGIKCPVCKKVTFLGESGFQSLPRNRVLDVILDKHNDRKDDNDSIKCDLCEDQTSEAAVMCEQCEIFYCDTCRNNCHPNRGPFTKHNLLNPEEGNVLIKSKKQEKDVKCANHQDQVLNLFCLTCKIPICAICHEDGPHINHDTKAIGAICKSQKSELSQMLQALSEKAKAETQFIQQLKTMADRIPENCMEFESLVISQCDSLIDSLMKRKQELLQLVSHERERKTKILKDQAASCTSHLQKTTGLLYFCVEVLKESDPTSFLQVSNSLLSRVATIDQNFFKDMELVPRVSPEFELTLDTSRVLHSIQTMNFYQIKAPGRPTIIPEDCSSENNSVTIAWQPYLDSIVEAYTLELDDGRGGDFRVVYVGRENICTVDGLHFDCIYNARVKAHNHAGESEYSELVSLQTAEEGIYSECMVEHHLLTETRRLLEHLQGVVQT